MDFTGCCSPYSSGSRLRIGWGCERGWLVRPLFRHRNDVSADCKLLEVLFVPDFLPLDRGLVLLEMRQLRLVAAH